LELWITSYEQKCTGELDIVDSFVNNAYEACGYITFGWACYVFTLYRKQILCGTHMPIQDYYTLCCRGNTKCDIIIKALFRILIFIPPAIVAGAFYILLKNQGIFTLESE
jgi:hypothetical protein